MSVIEPVELAGVDLERLSDGALLQLAHLVDAEQHRRALEAADPVALIAEGFNDGFDRRGLPLPPVLDHGVLRCHGSLIAKSAASHLCGFTAIDHQWCWQAESLIDDEVRRDGHSMMSVTLIAAHEGMVVEQVRSSSRQGLHQRQSVEAWQVTDGELVRCASRGAPPPHDRR